MKKSNTGSVERTSIRTNVAQAGNLGGSDPPKGSTWKAGREEKGTAKVNVIKFQQ